MIAPLAPQSPNAPNVGTASPDAARAPADILIAALAQANAARRDGMSMQDIDSNLVHDHGLTYNGLKAAVKAMPLETSNNWSEGELRKAFVKAQLYGVTGGWTDEIQGLIGKVRGTGYAKARDAAIKEQQKFEHDFPWLARIAKGNGLAAGVLVGGLGAKAATVLKAGIPLTTATLAGSDSPLIGAAAKALIGAGVGANAGAGGMLGETSGADRLPNMAAGALMGGTAGAATGIPVPANPIGKLLPWLGGGLVGSQGRKVLDYLTGGHRP